MLPTTDAGALLLVKFMETVIYSPITWTLVVLLIITGFIHSRIK